MTLPTNEKIGKITAFLTEEIQEEVDLLDSNATVCIFTHNYLETTEPLNTRHRIIMGLDVIPVAFFKFLTEKLELTKELFGPVVDYELGSIDKTHLSWEIELFMTFSFEQS